MMTIVLRAIRETQRKFLPAALYSIRQLNCASMKSLLTEIKGHHDRMEESTNLHSEPIARLNPSREISDLLGLIKCEQIHKQLVRTDSQKEN